MNIKWFRVGDKIPEDREMEVIGYWTPCCEEDSDREISIKRAGYNKENGAFVAANGGYFILPLFYRYLDSEEKMEFEV